MRHEPECTEPEGEPEEELAFLTFDDVKELHEASIRQFSPSESLTLLDAGRLDSAVKAPQHSYGGQYLYQSFAEMTAAYLVSLALNHAFENGNKRVAFAACSMFLRMNGFRLTLTQDEAVELTLNVVTGVWDREKAAQVIEEGMEEL